MAGGDELSPQAVAQRFARWVLPTLVPVAKRVLEAAEIRPRDSVLDMGTGIGLAAVLAVEQAGDGATVVGLERHADLLAIARERAAATGFTQVRWVEGDAERMEFAEETFDVGLSLFDLPAHRRLQDVLEELYRVLAPDARLSLAVWGRPAENEWCVLLRRAIQRAVPWVAWRDPQVFLTGRPGALEVPVQAAGFEEIESLRLPDRMRLPAPEACWEWVTGWPAIVQELAALGAERLEHVRRMLASLAAAHEDRQGEVVLRREIVYLRAFKREREEVED